MPIQLSHKFSRIFKPDKLNAPRGFKQANILTSNSFDIFLEIGAGKGKHALQFAYANPESKLFAVERTKVKISAFQKQLSASVLNNVKAIHADVIPWTVYALPPKSLNGVFILYPNPEYNNPNQRWLRMPYFEFLLSRLKDDAQITLTTNIQIYIEEANVMAKTKWNLRPNLFEVSKDSARTHFEIKYLARGETCWQLDMKKPSGYVTRFDNFSHIL